MTPHLYHTPDRKRWFLVPADARLAEGALRVRRFAGPAVDVDEVIAVHEVDEAAARAWIDARFRSSFARVGDAFGKVLEQLRGGGRTVPSAVDGPRPEVRDVLGVSAGEAATDAEKAKQAVANLVDWARRQGSDRTAALDGLGDALRAAAARVEARRSAAAKRRPQRKLVRVGFFAELRHGDPAGERLADARRAEPQADEAALVAYLKGAPVLIAALGPVRDVLDPSAGYIGTPSILTDGTWAWPADLAHYVERHHAALPDAFVTHARSRGFQHAPFDVTAARL
ncbi:MAG: hypothetical protein ABMA64_00355 [Myxococcota bacterium]